MRLHLKLAYTISNILCIGTLSPPVSPAFIQCVCLDLVVKFDAANPLDSVILAKKLQVQ